ncbi:MAG: hypothetical protein ACTSRI_21410 [Promethearchaeota archaeon]
MVETRVSFIFCVLENSTKLFICVDLLEGELAIIPTILYLFIIALRQSMPLSLFPANKILIIIFKD